jgi:hypothetical protein
MRRCAANADRGTFAPSHYQISPEQAGETLADPTTPQRREPRIPFKAPATVTVGQHSVAAHTKDITAHGLFFFTDVSLRTGAEIEIVLILPEELRLPFSGMVCGYGHVVRIERSVGQQYGIGVTIDRIAPVSQA